MEPGEKLSKQRQPTYCWSIPGIELAGNFAEWEESTCQTCLVLFEITL